MAMVDVSTILTYSLGGIPLSVMKEEKTSNDVVFMSYSIDAEGKITGKTRRQCTDYNAMITRENINGIKEEEYLEKLENRNNKI